MTKKAKKAVKALKKQQSAFLRHTDYEAQQEKIIAPFGKAFKTGGHRTSKRDISRKQAKQDLKRAG